MSMWNAKSWRNRIPSQIRGGFSMFKKNFDQTKAFIFFNCDENKSRESMNIFYNNKIYCNVRESRKELWNTIKKEVDEGRIIINAEDMLFVRREVLEGDPEIASCYIKYGSIVAFAMK